MEQGCTAPAKPTGMAPWSRHGQRSCQGSPGILLFEVVLCITLPGVAPGKFTIARPFHGVTLANPQGLSSPAMEEVEEEIHYVQTASKGL